ncbi:phosphoheptose isomerase [Marinomonas sp. CT5]|uniref:AGE family epimerase/isomerase n=1 Tax=Marinomonas sp. CT5 TaxID=2066133 RepID=UPI0018109282|nr:AGE family epimerase/isomerase [Marinomonas sp. CT5]NVK72699.1 AGE family epimerase/isomerase [Oceanospirillaceae bacterium]QUX96876.1 phosphoheptose isomerase [Marinomonas sp. CT5]
MLNSALTSSQAFLFDELLNNWSRYGIDKEQGFSYESMTHNWTPNPVGRIRLLTQCRQLYTFSHACQIKNKPDWFATLTPLFNFITSHYFIEERWIFSLNDNLTIKDKQSDAYALAFILLSFSHYYKVTKDDRALTYMKKTHQFLEENMRANTGGFYEAFPIDETQTRRQNPHMHLLEGYVAAFEATHDNHYKIAIQSLLSLALKHFYHKETKTLREFFCVDWSLDPEIGQQVEPGHHFEWVWLLHQANKILPNSDYTDLAQHLWQIASRHGLAKNGGIYNQIDGNSYQPIDKEKRIWPITEYLKAITVMPIGKEEKIDRLEKALNFAQQYYFLPNGRWNEYLNEDNTPKDFPLPGTSSYHIFLGLTEVVAWAEANTDLQNSF